MVQGTQVADELVGVEEGATRLLGIDGLTVVSVEVDVEGARVVHAVTDGSVAPACPKCGVVSTSPRGQARTRPRDVPYGDAPVRLVWHKRRWRCREAACPRGSFTEALPAVPPRARVTTRLRAECGAGIATRFSCVKAGAGLSGRSGARTVGEQAAEVTHLRTGRRRRWQWLAPGTQRDS